MIEFRCNLCGAHNSVSNPLAIHRELLNCVACGSSARFRGIVHAIQRELLGDRLGSVLRSAAERREIAGIGLSDSDVYSTELARIFSYTNTFYHADPVLDIMSAESVAKYQPVDFVVCSDVLEHVPPPAITAFHNLRRLVLPGGVLILTVPYLEGYETIEHYPHLFKWKTVEVADGYHALVNLRRGDLSRPDRVPYIECFPRPEYHGGPGEVLEMRLYGEGDLYARLAYAGFPYIESIEPNLPGIGYVWKYNAERPEFHDRKAKSCVMVCR
jgi:SAM-dependent methyltransferase